MYIEPFYCSRCAEALIGWGAMMMASDRDARAYTLRDLEQIARARNYLAWQLRLIKPELGHRIVDIGCGLGNLIEGLLDRDLVIAVDPDEELVARVARRFPERKNLHTFVCDVTANCFADLARFQPDSCVSVNVLEHIENDVQALRAMAGVLAPGGVIVLLVPAFQALYGPIDRKLGHYRRYTRASLGKVAAQAGLRIRKSHYLNSVGFFGWWANARILSRETHSERQIALFDRYVVPALSAVEAHLHPPFGQSLFAVLELESERRAD